MTPNQLKSELSTMAPAEILKILNVGPIDLINGMSKYIDDHVEQINESIFAHRKQYYYSRRYFGVS